MIFNNYDNNQDKHIAFDLWNKSMFFGIIQPSI